MLQSCLLCYSVSFIQLQYEVVKNGCDGFPPAHEPSHSQNYHQTGLIALLGSQNDISRL